MSTAETYLVEEPTSLEEVPTRQHLYDIVLGSVAIAGGAAIIYYGSGLPSHPGGAFGPGLFPSILGAFSIVFGVSLGVLASLRLRRNRSGTITEVAQVLTKDQEHDALSAAGSKPEPISTWKLWSDVVFALGAIVFYIFVAPYLGFIITVATIHIALMFKFGHKILWSVIIAIVSTLLLYWVFDGLLLIQLPEGILG